MIVDIPHASCSTSCSYFLQLDSKLSSSTFFTSYFSRYTGQGGQIKTVPEYPPYRNTTFCPHVKLDRNETDRFLDAARKRGRNKDEIMMHIEPSYSLVCATDILMVGLNNKVIKFAFFIIFPSYYDLKKKDTL